MMCVVSYVEMYRKELETHGQLAVEITYAEVDHHSFDKMI